MILFVAPKPPFSFKIKIVVMLKLLVAFEQKLVIFLRRDSVPGSDSIQKQITYAEFIDSSIDNNKTERPQKFRFEPQNIYNIFILPERNAKELFSYKGFATSEWKDNSKNYHKVHAVTLDTKFLLENAGKDKAQMQRRLAEIICSAFTDAELNSA